MLGEAPSLSACSTFPRKEHVYWLLLHMEMPSFGLRRPLFWLPGIGHVTFWEADSRTSSTKSLRMHLRCPSGKNIIHSWQVAVPTISSHVNHKWLNAPHCIHIAR